MYNPNKYLGPSEEFCYANGEAAYDFLINYEKLEPKNIIPFGRSLGSGPAVELAYRKPVGGLILQSPLLSAFRVVTGPTPFSLPYDIFCNVDKIQNIKCPVLIVHGQKDAVVPFEHGKRLYEMVKTRKDYLWIDNAGHNDIEYGWRKSFLQSITKFLDSLN